MLNNLTWLVTQADAVYVLPGPYKHSLGTLCEIAAARALGLEIRHLKKKKTKTLRQEACP